MQLSVFSGIISSIPLIGGIVMASSFSLDTPRLRLYLSHPDLAPAVSAYLRRNRAF